MNIHRFRNGYGIARGQVRANEDVMMIPLEIITTVSNQIAQEFHPEQIILFGSYAHGEPHRDSDVDLLVVMSHGMDNVYQAIEILNRVAPPFPIDLLVRTPGEVKQRIALQDTFMQNIMDLSLIHI